MSGSGKLFRIVSGINGWSLVVVGGLSLSISLISSAWAGVAISLAAVFHGFAELVLRKRVLRGDSGAARWMALNQIGLAASLSVYFTYQFVTLDGEALSASMKSPPLSDLLMLYSEPTRSQLVDTLPHLVGAFYALVAGVSWVVCGGTAIYYSNQRR